MSIWNRGREKLYDNVYRAVLICKLAGLSFAETRRIVREVFEVIPKKKIPRSMLKNWYYGHKKHRMTRLNALDKSLWYCKAYELALELKREHHNWGYKKIATKIRKKLPIRVPPMTVYFWITGRSKPNITPLKMCPELGYLVGVLVGDRRRTGDGLKVKDREFIEYYAHMYEKATGVKPNVILDRDGYHRTSEGGGFLKALWLTELWKVVAYIYPRQFLQGLFDSEGCISFRKSSPSYILKISTGNLEVLLTATKLLKKLGYKTKTYIKPPQTRTIGGRKIHFNQSYDLRILGGKKALYKFAAEVGFREGKRRKRLAALIEAFKHPPKEIHKTYLKLTTPSPNFAILTQKIRKKG